MPDFTKYKTATEIISQVATEIGLGEQVDPYSSTDKAIVQLVSFVNPTGIELLGEYQWQQLEREWNFTTVASQNEYDLPDNFDHLIDQTGWERNENVPVLGPLSAQDWQYLAGRNLVSQTIYATFRKTQGKMWFYPVALPGGLDIAFEYVCREWVNSGATARDNVENGGDTINFDSYLFERLLKVKWKDAKGYDTTKDQATYNRALEVWTGKDKPAPMLNAGSPRFSGQAFVDPWRNVPDTNYGS